MTIIHNYNKNNREAILILHSNKRLFSRKKRKWRNLISGAGEYLGHIKLAFFLMVPFLAIGICWLLLFGWNISLDYRIYNLKHELSKAEEEINLLQEKSIEMTLSQRIEEWAEANDFIKVDGISYLDLTHENLAQR